MLSKITGKNDIDDILDIILNTKYDINNIENYNHTAIN